MPTSGPAWTGIYYVIKLSVSRRQALLQFAGYIIAHLTVFAFLFQVFDNRGVIMKICCYFQLGLLLLCFMLYVLSYVLSYLLDLAAILRIKKSALDIENIVRRVNMFPPPRC